MTAKESPVLVASRTGLKRSPLRLAEHSHDSTVVRAGAQTRARAGAQTRRLPVSAAAGASVARAERASGGTARAAAAVALDPEENIRTKSGAPGVVETAPEVLTKGHWSRQYRAAATRNGWGEEGRRGCGSSSLVRFQDGRLTIYPVLCDTWACDVCGPKRAAWLKRQLKNNIDSGLLSSFWTLTFHRPKGEEVTPDAITLAFHSIQRHWHEAARVLRRRFGRFSYIWIIEPTKVGWPHFHLLTSLDIPESELSDIWRNVTGNSWMVDVQAVTSAKASDYLTKYCTKSARARKSEALAGIAGTRLFSRSRDVPFDPFRPVDPEATGEVEGQLGEVVPFERVSIPFHDCVRQYHKAGWRIHEARDQGTPKAVFQGRYRSLSADGE